jgi:hypothetical protein
MNITKEQENQIRQACVKAGEKRMRYDKRSGVLDHPITTVEARSRAFASPIHFDIEVDNFEVKYLIACAELGFTDDIVINFPKWKKGELK